MKARLTRAIERMRAEGGDANRAVLAGHPGWLVLTTSPDAPNARTIVAAGPYLAGDRKMDADRHEWLIDNGFERRTVADPYHREGPLGDAEVLAEETWALYEWVFGAAAERVDVQLGSAPALDDTRLTERMRAVAGEKTPRMRNRLYMGMVRATFVVPVVAPTDAVGIGADISLRDAGELGGGRVVAIFSSWDNLLRHDPRGLPVVVMPGIDLFPLLAERSITSVLVNPRSAVGGELYRHEIQTIADGCRRLAGAH